VRDDATVRPRSTRPRRRFSVAPHPGYAFAQPEPRPSTLPQQPTPLIGRAHEVETITQELARPEVRLLTLTGPAGTGKTRLALEAAAIVGPRFRHGVCLVGLAALSDPRLVLSEIAAALAVRETPSRSLLDGLKQALASRQLLLLLDNMEQVIEAAPQVGEILAACPGVKVLATSRANFRLRWEHEFPVPPLALPSLAPLPATDELARIPAVALFLERAQALNPGLRLSDQNAGAIAEICVRLDGLPLAIELAAARTKLLPPQAIRDRLGQRFELLSGDVQDRPDRHQTLRAAIAWSYDLLDPAQQELFRRLSAFVGGATLEAAEELGSLEQIMSLIDKSLLRQEADRDGEPRFTMLETIRAFGLEQLADTGELDGARRHHCAYYLALAEEAEPRLSGPDEGRWLERLEREHDNFRAALRWCIDAREAELGARLGGALWRFWATRGHLREGRAWLAELRASTGGAPTPAVAKVLAGSGSLAFYQGDYRAARALHEASLRLWRQLGNQREEARALGSLGDVAHQQGDYAAAQALHEQSLQALRAVGDEPGIAQALIQLGLTVRVRGDYDTARRLYEEALAISRALGNRGFEALVLNNQGRTAYYQGDAAAARALHEAALALRRELGDRRGMAMSLADLGDAAEKQADTRSARALREESLALWRELGDRWGLAYVLEGFAKMAMEQGQPERAVRLLGAASATRESLNAPRSPASRARLEQLLEQARGGLTGEAYERAWREGAAMSGDEAAALALAADGPAPARPAGGDHGLQRLSRREREVAALVARGYTNRQIAEALVIGDRTADTHVANILAKLELSSRTQIAVWGVEHGLLEPEA
jgi:predicted ATPase/DNA-binding CsgD family transcriptional regulator